MVIRTVHRDMRVRSLAGTLMLVAVVSCTGSTPIIVDGSPPPPFVPTPPAVPLVCPKHPPAHPSSAGVPGTTHSLVPGQPQVVVICQDTRVVLEGQRLDFFVRQLNALRRVPRPNIFACPMDLGPVYWLYFDYPGGGVVRVTADAGGCRFASNGRYQAFSTTPLLHELLRIQRLAA